MEQFADDRFLEDIIQSKYVVVLNNNGYDYDRYGKYELLAASSDEAELNAGWNSLVIDNSTNSWRFGFFGYDLKNRTENLFSQNPDYVGMPESMLFQPKKIKVILRNENSPFSFIDKTLRITKRTHQQAIFRNRVSKQEYIRNVNKIKQHIQRGDIYEMNYCIEFFIENIEINPWQLYQKLNSLSPAPFSCFVKCNDKFLMSASPERFIAKRGNKIISQPIKGTAKRGITPDDDFRRLNELRDSPKNRSENIMAVDVVRNDLSRTATAGSVCVEELCEVYSFPYVHQLISTVVAEKKVGISSLEVLKRAFPMASMTGAPKIRAMQLIEDFETTKRGLFSGTVGYFDPEDDFDFNVVIRSLQYDSETRYLSYIAGGAITHYSDPEQEYEECLLKAAALTDLFG